MEEEVNCRRLEVVGAVSSNSQSIDQVKSSEQPQADVAVEVVAKRKRGRPAKGQARMPPVNKVNEEEEDVCFICFDGGDLVLCDRRGCPKAYHPTCIKRDAAFFQSPAKWICGWHICSMCQKTAHHMCYTCTYSLCKGCIKKADYVCVRGDKGFCTLCMKTIMLIENNVQGREEMAQVDFDDTTSWEYLFKVYWVYLKEKLSLTVDELTQAKNPWKRAGRIGRECISPNVQRGANDLKILQNGSNDLKSLQNEVNHQTLQHGASALATLAPENLEASNIKRIKTDEQLNLLHEATLILEKEGDESGAEMVGSKEVATVENVLSASEGEADKLWHYRDPSGIIQGPFTMVQLQKWSTNGYFPSDKRIWARSEEYSVLLTDALKDEFKKEVQHNAPSQLEAGGAKSSPQRISNQSDGTLTHMLQPCSALSAPNVQNEGHVSSVLPVRDSDSLDLPSATRRSSNTSDLVLDNQEKQSVHSKLAVQDSGLSWSTASNIGVGGGGQLTGIANDWAGHSSTPAVPSTSEWNSGLACVSSTNLPHSNTDQLIHSSESQPASTMTWQGQGEGLIEFYSLAEESVSDLLAEVDAMESQNGLPSPTSKSNFVYDLFHGSFEDFSPTPDQGARSDGFSSNGDMHLRCQSTTPEEQVGPSNGVVFDFFKRSEVEGEAKSSVTQVRDGNNVGTYDAPRESSANNVASLNGVEKVQDAPRESYG